MYWPNQCYLNWKNLPEKARHRHTLAHTHKQIDTDTDTRACTHPHPHPRMDKCARTERQTEPQTDTNTYTHCCGAAGGIQQEPECPCVGCWQAGETSTAISTDNTEGSVRLVEEGSGEWHRDNRATFCKRIGYRKAGVFLWVEKLFFSKVPHHLSMGFEVIGDWLHQILYSCMLWEIRLRLLKPLIRDCRRQLQKKYCLYCGTFLCEIFFVNIKWCWHCRLT